MLKYFQALMLFLQRKTNWSYLASISKEYINTVHITHIICFLFHTNTTLVIRVFTMLLFSGGYLPNSTKLSAILSYIMQVLNKGYALILNQYNNALMTYIIKLLNIVDFSFTNWSLDSWKRLKKEKRLN